MSTNFKNIFLSQMLEPTPSDLTKTKFEELYNLYIKSFNNNELDNAITYAQKITFLFGVVGIVLYVKAIEKLISELVIKGENCQQLAYNTLVYLNLSQRLYENQKEGTDKLDRIFPLINWKSRKEWSKIRNNLIKEASIENLQESAVRFAVKFYQNIQK